MASCPPSCMTAHHRNIACKLPHICYLMFKSGIVFHVADVRVVDDDPVVNAPVKSVLVFSTCRSLMLSYSYRMFEVLFCNQLLKEHYM